MIKQIYKDNFGVIFSIGSACKPAYQLKCNYLRQFAAPLDYQMGYSLRTVLHLFQTKFEDFFLKIEEDFGGGATGKRKVIDTANHIISLHHFPKEDTLELGQDRFREKMMQRYHRLDSAICKSPAFAMICDRSDEIEKLKQFLLDFSFLYPDKKIVLLAVRNHMEMCSIDMTEYEVSNRLKIVEYKFSDHNPKTSYGNDEAWKEILAGIRLIS